MNPRPLHHRHHPNRTAARGTRRAFTLMEVMLAAVLGAMVVGASLAMFSMMDRARKLQNDRLETNTELAFAHKVLQQAFRTLLMENSPEPKDDDLKNKIKQDIDDAAEDKTHERRDDAATMRFALQPDNSKRSYDGSLLQTIDLTLTTPPVHAVSRSLTADEEVNAQLRLLALARNRDTNVWSDRSSTSRLGSSTSRLSGSSTSGTKSGIGKTSADGSSTSRERNPSATSARADRLRSGAAGLGGGSADDRVSSLANQEIDAPRAPGVRGVFEFRQEDDPKVIARLAASGLQNANAWSLWWKQIPPDDDLDIPPSTDTAGEGANAAKARTDRLRLIELARASRTDTPEVKLLSGIGSAQWQVYRRRKMVNKMAAAHAKELPAYVNLKFDTIDGRHQDWLFEIAWFYGQEPGTVLAVNDPLGAPFDPNNSDGGGDSTIAAAVQAALDAANGGGRGGTGTTPTGGGTGPIASAGGSGGPRGGFGSGGSGAGAGTGGTSGGGAHGGTANGPVTGGHGRPIVITLPDGSTITIPANAQPGR